MWIDDILFPDVMTPGAFPDKGIREMPEHAPETNIPDAEETEITGARHGGMTFS
jgi:hypothetical protein